MNSGYKDELILQMIDEVKHLQKEIIALRHYLIKDYPYLQDELFSDLTPLFYNCDQYQRFTEELNEDPFEDKDYGQDLKKLKENGKCEPCYPFSIYID